MNLRTFRRVSLLSAFPQVRSLKKMFVLAVALSFCAGAFSAQTDTVETTTFSNDKVLRENG